MKHFHCKRRLLASGFNIFLPEIPVEYFDKLFLLPGEKNGIGSHSSEKRFNAEIDAILEYKCITSTHHKQDFHHFKN